MVVMKLNTKNWRVFKTAVQESLLQIYGHNKILLTYVIRPNATGNYMDVYDTSIACLVACTVHHGDAFVHDNQNVYSLLVQYVGDLREAKSIMDCFKRSKLGRDAWLGLTNLYESASYKANLATEAMTTIRDAHYNGDKPNFSITTYHSILSKAFTNLLDAGPAHWLNDQQQITTFKRGLTDKEAIRCATNDDKHLRTLPAHEQLFSTWYNTLHSDLAAFLTLTKHPTTSTQHIRQLTTRGGGGHGGRSSRFTHGGNFSPYSRAPDRGGCDGRTPYRGCGRGGLIDNGRGGRRNRDRGPHNGHFAPTQFQRQLKFIPHKNLMLYPLCNVGHIAT